MGKPTGLNKRKGSSAWYYRRRFPSHVAERLGRREFVQSLNTSSYAEALKRLPAAEVAYLGAIADPNDAIAIRRTTISPIRRTDGGLRQLSLEDAKTLAREHFCSSLEGLDSEAIPSTRSPAWDHLVGDVEWQLETLGDGDDPNTCRWIEAEEIELLNRHNFKADPSKPASQLLRQYLRRSMLQLTRIRHARLHGDYGDRITDGLFQTLTGSDAFQSAPDRRTVSLGKLIELFKDEHLSTEELSSKTVRKAEAALAIIGRYFHHSAAVASIDRDACYAFRDTLAKLPANVTKKHGKSANLKRIAEANASAGGPGLNKQTQEHYLRTLRRVLGLAKDRRFVSENAADGLKPKGRSVRNEAKRNSYSKVQLQQIFSAPLYTGCKDDEHGYSTPGPRVIRRSRFWVPLIALFTGMRLEEILQLTSDHVASDEKGEPYLFVSPDMKVKTVNGYRHVPVHRELLKIGFIRLVEEARKRPDKVLFPDVPTGSDDYRSSVFSKRYATFLRSLKLEDAERKVTFHSFRHTFRDQLRRPDVNPDLVRELGGWSRGSETSTAYGDGTPAHVLRPLVDGIDYGIDLRHLYVTI